MGLEKRALDILSLSVRGLRPNGLRQTVKEAVGWANQFNYDFEAEDMVKNWQHPQFIPDATRWRKCFPSHAKHIYTSCVEIWEIENTHPLTQSKIDHVINWIGAFWDPISHPFFELWRCDGWGRGEHRIYSTATDLYGITLVDCDVT